MFVRLAHPRAALALLGSLAPFILPSCRPQGAPSSLTRAERTDYRETTRYDEVVAFIREVAARSSRLNVTTMGYTFEGRPIPLVVVGDVSDASPEAVRASGKTRVYLQGGIHAGEIGGKEALLMLLRDLAGGGHPEWSDSLVLLVAPLYNADGHERVNLFNRPRQNGPVGGMGQRTNAQDYDLNRDHLKLDAPETRSLVRMFVQYDPGVTVDLHTTNGSRHGYFLTYAPPLNPNTPHAIDDLLRSRLLPTVTRVVKEKHGWDMHDFGDVRSARRGAEAGWYTFDHRARYSNNYSGLRNRFGILGEAFAYATFHDRIFISLWFVEEILNFTHDHATEIRQTAAEADSSSVVGKELALRSTFQRSAEPATILMGEVEEELNPYSGAIMLRRTGVQEPEEMYEYISFQATESQRAPDSYFLPAVPDRPLQAVLEDIRARLEAHGITTRALSEARSVDVEEFVIDSLTTATREYQGRFEQTVFGSYGTRTRTLEPGTVEIPMDQPLARVAFTLLEPRSDDGFVAWGFFTDLIRAGEVFPVLRASPGGSPSTHATPRDPS